MFKRIILFLKKAVLKTYFTKVVKSLSYLLPLLTLWGLMQTITPATRTNDNSSTLIDVILSNRQNNLLYSAIFKTICYHELIS